jgi:hypothetical protein
VTAERQREQEAAGPSSREAAVAGEVNSLKERLTASNRTAFSLREIIAGKETEKKLQEASIEQHEKDSNLMQEEMLMMKEGTMRVRPRLYEVLVKAIREENPDTEIVKEIANFAYLPEFSLSKDGSSMVAPIDFMMEVEQDLGQEFREVFLGAKDDIMKRILVRKQKAQEGSIFRENSGRLRKRRRPGKSGETPEWEQMEQERLELELAAAQGSAVQRSATVSAITSVGIGSVRSIGTESSGNVVENMEEMAEVGTVPDSEDWPDGPAAASSPGLAAASPFPHQDSLPSSPSGTDSQNSMNVSPIDTPFDHPLYPPLF